MSFIFAFLPPFLLLSPLSLTFYWGFSLFLSFVRPSFVRSFRYSASKPLAPAMIGVIAGLVTVLFGLALFALYRSQRKKNASRRELLERERTRASSSSVRSEGSGGEGAGERKERAGSYSSQGTMVERDTSEKGAGLVKKMSPTSALS